MAESESGRGFIFTWKIKNFSFLWHREHQYLRRIFYMKGSTTTSWSLLLYPSTPKNCVSCVLRKESGEYLNFQVDYDLSFLRLDGSPLHSIKISSANFNLISRSVQLWLHQDEILENKEESLAEDTLSIRCVIWKTYPSIQEVARYLAKTEIKVQRCTFTWKIFAFSNLNAGQKRTRFAKKLTGKRCINFNFFLDEWNDMILEVYVLDPKFVELCKCQIFVVDVSGKKVKCGRFEIVTIGKTTDRNWKFHLSLTKRNLIETKELYLPNDTLTLECEAAFATGIGDEPVQNLESDSQHIQNILCDTEKNINISESLKKHPESLPDGQNEIYSSNIPGSFEAEVVSLKPAESSLSTSSKSDTIPNSSFPWKNDLLILYDKGTFCDAELLVGITNFPVHSLILSIRSPKFCDLFAGAKSDGKKLSIPIEGLDADTVGKMILFLYTDNLEDLQWDCARGLYIASNEYEILTLKDISSIFLKQNLNTINCCEILLLADEYKDDNLKKTAQDFITKNDEVLNSDRWKSLEDNHPRLIIETFRYIHLKSQKN